MAIIPRTRLPQSPSQPSLAPRGSIVPVQDISGPSQAALSDGMSKVARLAAQKYQEDRNRELQARVMEYDIDRRRSDGIVIDSYLQQFGKNAVDGRAQAFASIEANSQRVRDSITDPEVADLWKQQDAALTNAAYSQLDSHYRQQSLRHQTDTLTERADMLVSTVERVAFGEGYDPATGRLSAEAERTRSAYLDSISQLGNRMGWSPERLTNEQRKADTVAYGQIAESLIRSDRFDEASAVLSAHGDRIDPGERSKLQDRVQTQKGRADALAQKKASEAKAWEYANTLARTDAPYEEKLAAINQSVATGRIDADTAEKSLRLMEHLDDQRVQAVRRQRDQLGTKIEQLFASDESQSVDTLDAETMQKVNELGMRHDVFRIHRTVRENRIADMLAEGDATSLMLSRDVRSIGEIERVIERLQDRMPTATKNKDGVVQPLDSTSEQKRRKIQERIQMLEQYQEQLALRPRTFVSQHDLPVPGPVGRKTAVAQDDGDPSTPPQIDMAEVMRQMRQALYPGSGR